MTITTGNSTCIVHTINSTTITCRVQGGVIGVYVAVQIFIGLGVYRTSALGGAGFSYESMSRIITFVLLLLMLMLMVKLLLVLMVKLLLMLMVKLLLMLMVTLLLMLMVKLLLVNC